MTIIPHHLLSALTTYVVTGWRPIAGQGLAGAQLTDHSMISLEAIRKFEFICGEKAAEMCSNMCKGKDMVSKQYQ